MIISYEKEACTKLNIYVDCEKECDIPECAEINVYVNCNKERKDYKDDKNYKKRECYKKVEVYRGDKCNSETTRY